MRSSESTPSLPERPIRLGIVLVGDDHPRQCTGRRLLRQGLARRLRAGTVRDRAIVLDPYATRPLTAADGAWAEEAGLIAVDCSWNRLSARRASRSSATTGQRGGTPRRLPILVAANPQHYGRVGELNTAEALAAALYLLGRPNEAAQVASGFAGGASFLDLNRERLDRYASARSAEELAATERALFGGNGRVPADRTRPTVPSPSAGAGARYR